MNGKYLKDRNLQNATTNSATFILVYVLFCSNDTKSGLIDNDTENGLILQSLQKKMVIQSYICSVGRFFYAKQVFSYYI